MSPGELEAIRSVTAIHQPKRADNLAECAFRELLNTRHIPRASLLLDRVHDAANAALDEGDLIGAEKMLSLFFKVCGLIKKPSDEAVVQATAKALVDAMIAEAKARREVKP